jgi:hypothetical protein
MIQPIYCTSSEVRRLLGGYLRSTLVRVVNRSGEALRLRRKVSAITRTSHYESFTMSGTVVMF